MKKLLILFLLTSVFCFGQTAKIHYNLAYNVQLTEEDKNEVKKKVSSAPSFLLNKLFRLFTKNSDKKYLFELTISNDKSYYRMIEDPQDTSLLKYAAKGDDAVTTDLKTGITLQEEDFRGNEFLVSRDTKDFEWEITEESKKIGQYTCYKAKVIIKGGKKNKEIPVLAWFTPEIPFSAGPAIYSGLPGLVVYVQIERASILLKDIEIGAKVKEIKEPTKGIKMNKNEYLEYMKNTESRKLF